MNKAIVTLVLVFGISTVVYFLLFNKTDTKSVPTSAGLEEKTDNSNSSTQSEFRRLSINGPRCIGCGKCARFDQQHFRMDNSLRQAVVISSSDLDSSQLAFAVSSCPTQAIVLE